jgi:hypothetical protein
MHCWFYTSNVFGGIGFIQYYRNLELIPLSNRIQKIMVVLFIVFLISDSPILFAITDLTNGKAAKYSQEIVNRIQLIQNSNQNEVIVPALQNKPKTLYSEIIMGLTDDVKDWRNEDISIYFKKEIVVNLVLFFVE